MHVNNYSSWLQIQKSGGLRPENNSGERTTATGGRRKTTVVGFKWRTLGKTPQWLASNGEQ